MRGPIPNQGSNAGQSGGSSPNHLEWMALMLTLIKWAPLSLATALASIVCK